MPRSKGSSHRWRQRQTRDPYVERAVEGGWRSRAAFKLIEINSRERILKRGAVVVDLGAAPGGWSQVAASQVGTEGRILALDRLPMDPIEGVEFLQADLLDAEGLRWLHERVGERAVDLVMSDMAPNISGNRAIDQPRSLALVEVAVMFAREVLKPGGSMLIKLFQGEGQRELELELKREFERLRRVKPKASRAESREIYVLACNYRMV